ncbi:unnamed protein product, partial [Meganyctiphanes norvegica]
EKIDLRCYLKDTLLLKMKISENKNTKNKKMLLKKIKARENDLNMKIMKLDKKTPCEKRDFFSVFYKNNQIPPDENCEDFKSVDYKARKVISLTHSYENSSDIEDALKLAKMLPTVTVLEE